MGVVFLVLGKKHYTRFQPRRREGWRNEATRPQGWMECRKLDKAAAGTGAATASRCPWTLGKSAMTHVLSELPGQEFKADKKLLGSYLCYSFTLKEGASLRQQLVF